MTNKEALTALLPFIIEDGLIEKTLSDHSLNGSGIYTIENKKEIDLCLADILFYIASRPSFSEGELSMQFNTDSLLSERERILRKYNLSEGGLNGESQW